MRTVRLFLVWVSIAGLPVLAAAEPQLAAGRTSKDADVGADGSWVGGIGAAGMRGVHRVDAGFPIQAGDLILLLSGEYSYARDLFEPDDLNQRSGQHITVVWSPVANVAIAATQSMVSNRNTAFEPRTTQTLGDPSLGLKVAMPLGSLGVGGVVAVTLPTSAQGNGLQAKAFVLDGRAAVSMLATRWLSVSANVGYRLDNSRKIFDRPILDVQRFAANISQKNAILAGLGIETGFSVGDMMVLGPFAELSAGIPVGGTTAQGPVRATVGAKLQPLGLDTLDVALGADYALKGKPVAGGEMAGIPPWEVFGSIAAHVGPKPQAAAKVTGPMVCAADADCLEAQACIDGYCGRLKVVKEEIIKEVERPAPSFTVEGGVFDQTTGDPVGNATVTFSGVGGSALAVDYKAGTFKSWPIPAGDGLLKVSVAAPGYRPYEETLQKGKGGEVKSLTLKIQNAGEAALGEIKGSLKDATSGQPIKNGQIFIPILNQKIKSDAEGKFSAQLKAGRYQVLISGNKFITQKKEVEIRAGDVVIFNVDMTPKK